MELDFLLAKLKMDHLDAQVETLCEQAAQRELDYRSFLTEALAVEWQGRDRRGIETRLRQARFPWIKTLEQFDFEFQPSLDRRQVRELSSLRFVERAHNIVILGPPGVGKTHLSVGVGGESGRGGLFRPVSEPGIADDPLAQGPTRKPSGPHFETARLSQSADHRRDRLPAPEP